MSLHKELRLVPFAAKEMFELVKDVQSYQDFLPWVEESTIYNVQHNQFDANLVVGVAAFKQKYSSRVICDQENLTVTSDLIDGPFKYLRNEWLFKDVSEEFDSQCEISFSLDFEIDQMILKAILAPFLSDAAKVMIEAFEKRAQDLKIKKID